MILKLTKDIKIIGLLDKHCPVMHSHLGDVQLSWMMLNGYFSYIFLTKFAKVLHGFHFQEKIADVIHVLKLKLYYYEF